MITGLRFEIGHEELKAHLLARADHHEQRRKTKEAELPGLEAALDKIKSNALSLPSSVSNFNKGGYNLDPDSPIDKLRQDISTHQHKAIAFKWLAGHLFQDTYSLAEDDLIRLEILKQRY